MGVWEGGWVGFKANSIILAQIICAAQKKISQTFH